MIQDGEINYLVMVDSGKNSNKYYKIERVGNELICTYGRVQEPRSQTKTYELGRYYKLYDSKIKKGYKDQTHLYAEAASPTPANVNVISGDDPASNFARYLRQNARNVAQAALSVDLDKVTANMVEASELQLQVIVDTLESDVDFKIGEANNALLEQFTIIPRFIDRSEGVKSKLFVEDDDPWNDAILENEYELLDKIKTILEQQDDTPSDNQPSALWEIFKADEEATLCDRFKEGIVDQYAGATVIEVFEINHVPASAAFENVNVELLWHGSKTANWNSIIQNELQVKPPGIPTTGSMFGNGIYFAPLAQKSLGYSSLRGGYWSGGADDIGVLALFEVSLGKVHRSKGEQYYEYIEDTVANGFDSLWVESKRTNPNSLLYNEEIIVPRTKQTKIKYIFKVGYEY